MKTARCECGKYITLSHSYRMDTIPCKHCGRTVEIESNDTSNKH